METLDVTTMTSRGQIVIPQTVRKALKIVEGSKFVVAGSVDTIILKRLELPSIQELKSLLAQSRKMAQKKLKKKAVDKIIQEEKARM